MNNIENNFFLRGREYYQDSKGQHWVDDGHWREKLSVEDYQDFKGQVEILHALLVEEMSEMADECCWLGKE